MAREGLARGIVRVHDFLIKELGQRDTLRLYDLADDAAWASLGMSCDTAAFAVATIRRWRLEIGRLRYPGATRLVITADGGGSNGSCVRLWKLMRQRTTPTNLRSRYRGPSFSARDQQVEQDRAPAVLLHQHEPARHAASPSYQMIIEHDLLETTKTQSRFDCELDADEYLTAC